MAVALQKGSSKSNIFEENALETLLAVGKVWATDHVLFYMLLEH